MKDGETSFLEFLRMFSELPLEDYENLMGSAISKKVKKGTTLIRPGQTQKEILIVENGVQISYHESENSLHVAAFTYPPGLCAIPGSFSFQKPSRYYLKCLTNSEFKAISHKNLEENFIRSRALERVFRRMTESILEGIISRHIELHTLTIEERFRSFCSRSPHLLQLVPHKYIASYLNIDKTNFSKLFNTVRL